MTIIRRTATPAKLPMMVVVEDEESLIVALSPILGSIVIVVVVVVVFLVGDSEAPDGVIITLGGSLVFVIDGVVDGVMVW